jgi:hypothetical protein
MGYVGGGGPPSPPLILRKVLETDTLCLYLYWESLAPRSNRGAVGERFCQARSFPF